MNLKSNKGYVGVDISVAVIIFLIIVPTIMGIIFSANSSSNSVKVKSEALSILTNAIETAKGMPIEDVNATDLLNQFKTSNSQYTTTVGENEDIVQTSTASYKLKYVVVDYKEKDESLYKENIVKTVTATITYKIGSTEKSIELSTVIT